MDENRLWDLSDKWLPEPVPATPGIDSKQVKRSRIVKSPLPQTSKVLELGPKTVTPGGSKELVSQPPKVMVVKDPKFPPAAGSKPPSLLQQSLAKGRPLVEPAARPPPPRKNNQRPAAIGEARIQPKAAKSK
eukprot:11623948-Karenia_brevis.AAC.1